MAIRSLLRFFRVVWYSFPTQLLITNLKKNQVMILFWVILFGFLVFDWGKVFGIPYLFLDPEYNGKVNARSLFVVGLAFGLFNISFQITCYILDSDRFRFLATVRNAIFKFAINNSILPLIYLFCFIYRFWTFQTERSLETPFEAFLEALAFVGGFLWIQLFAFAYFRTVQSRELLSLSTRLDRKLRNLSLYRLSLWKRMRTFRGSQTKVRHFFNSDFSVEETRSAAVPVRIATDEETFSSYHLSAVFLELLTILGLVALGFFSGSAIFQIPAAASVFLLFGFVLMVIGALSFWLRGWSITLFIGLILLVNFLFSYGWLNREYQAFGLNYAIKKEYSVKSIKAHAKPEFYTQDSLETIQILNNWKQKLGEEKPKIVFICTSGGGIRAATWTMRTLQFLDSTLNSSLMEHTSLITGASGGLIGAAYFRELFLQSKIETQIDYFERKYIDNISKDILNPVVFSMVTNDLLVRLKKHKDGPYEYPSDRGFVFEQTLHQNLHNALNKKLFHYKNPERTGQIPMMFISPVIVNDGRKLYISPQKISYMTWEKNQIGVTPSLKLAKGIEFSRFFDSCDASRLHFSSALRMNATFPYITPNITLPTLPATEVMDGGLGDNFGVADALKFIHIFRDWIQIETGGVIMVCIRDTPKDRPFRKKSNDSWFSRMVNPLGSVYTNWARNQDYNNDMQQVYLQEGLKVPVEFITFQYLAKSDDPEANLHHGNEDRASLSWHLTTFEKQGIESSILHPQNQAAMNRLFSLLKAEP